MNKKKYVAYDDTFTAARRSPHVGHHRLEDRIAYAKALRASMIFKGFDYTQPHGRANKALARIAAAVGCSDSAIRNYMNAMSLPSPQMAKKIEGILGELPRLTGTRNAGNIGLKLRPRGRPKGISSKRYASPIAVAESPAAIANKQNHELSQPERAIKAKIIELGLAAYIELLHEQARSW